MILITLKETFKEFYNSNVMKQAFTINYIALNLMKFDEKKSRIKM